MIHEKGFFSAATGCISTIITPDRSQEKYSSQRAEGKSGFSLTWISPHSRGFIVREENTAQGTYLMIGMAVITVLLAFAFTFTNGFQDASSIAATFIASRSASPKSGIIFVAGVALLGESLGEALLPLPFPGCLSCLLMSKPCWYF